MLKTPTGFCPVLRGAGAAVVPETALLELTSSLRCRPVTTPNNPEYGDCSEGVPGGWPRLRRRRLKAEN